MKRLHERKAASSEDLRSALAALIDAQAQLAEARGSRSELIELHRRRVELARERLEQVEMLREKNAAGAVELVDAREALIRAQIRLELVTGA